MIDAHTDGRARRCAARGVGGRAPRARARRRLESLRRRRAVRRHGRPRAAPPASSALPSARDGFVRLRVQAGHDWDALVAYAVAEGLAGIEAMSGIPGTVGAAPVQNIGAYGQEIVQTLAEVELIDEFTGEVSTVPAAELGLGFRTSVLKHHYGSVPERPAVILTVTLELEQVGHGGTPRGRRAAAHRARTRSPRHPSRWPGSATTCWPRGAARAWCSTRTTPTRTAPARSSRTRSCRPRSPARFRPSARAGR